MHYHRYGITGGFQLGLNELVHRTLASGAIRHSAESMNLVFVQPLDDTEVYSFIGKFGNGSVLIMASQGLAHVLAAMLVFARSQGSGEAEIAIPVNPNWNVVKDLENHTMGPLNAGTIQFLLYLERILRG